MLGIPIATHKVEGPTTLLIFLGIEFNTVGMTMQPPQQKLQCLKALIAECCVTRTSQRSRQFSFS
jgi:hypothetical protein